MMKKFVLGVAALAAVFGGQAAVHADAAQAACNYSTYEPGMQGPPPGYTLVFYGGTMGCTAGDQGAVYEVLQRYNPFNGTWLSVDSSSVMYGGLTGEHVTNNLCYNMGGHAIYRSQMRWDNYTTGTYGNVSTSGGVWTC